MIPLQLTFIVPPLVADAPEIDALLRTLEATWPELTLTFRAEPGGPEGARLIPVPDRTQWIAERFAHTQHAQLFSGRDQPPINVNFAPHARLSQDGTVGARVTVWLPATLESGQLARVFETSGDALAAWYGWYMPVTSGALIMVIATKSPPTAPVAALLQAVPELAELANLRVRHPASTVRVPTTIGWLNYWSDVTASSLQFRPQDALGGATRTARGAWNWKLTADPFDVQRADHAAALLEAYRRLRGTAHAG
jgi:hypothetical protein